VEEVVIVEEGEQEWWVGALVLEGMEHWAVHTYNKEKGDIDSFKKLQMMVNCSQIPQHSL